ncbi:MAG: gamma-glutamyl-gamma-aminobutyrate hydrolase family protein [Bdellovibrionota bacterium]
MFFIISSTCLGSVQLFIVQPTPHHDKYLIVAQDGESPAQAMNRYKTLLRNSPHLSSLVSPEQLKQFSYGHGDYFELGEKPAVLILANRGYDLSNEEKSGGQLRVQKFKEKIGQNNDVYILPVAAALGLTKLNRELFYKSLTDKFSGVVALGGPDVNPSVYGDENREAREVNLYRDQYEIHFLKHWISAKKGFLFGVCRGHHMISAALGFKLVQHVENHGDGVWVDHPIKFLKTAQNFLSRAAGVREMIVNSYHHQAVKYSPHPDIDLAAVAPDNTVEALESKDGRIVSTQFHVEFMENIFAEKIFSRINEKFRENFRTANEKFRAESQKNHSAKAGMCSHLF